MKAHRGKVIRKMHARSLADLVNKGATLQPSDHPLLGQYVKIV